MGHYTTGEALFSLYIPVTTLDDSHTQYFKGKRQIAEEYIQSDIIQNIKIGRMMEIHRCNIPRYLGFQEVRFSK